MKKRRKGRKEGKNKSLKIFKTSLKNLKEKI